MTNPPSDLTEHSTHSLRTPTNAVEIPSLGYGVWQVPDEVAVDVVGLAVDAGYRHVDTARIYGNEAGVGQALSQMSVPREDVFVTTKLWNDDQGGIDTVRAALTGSMERLGLDVLDLYLIHWPAPRAGRFVETWQAMRTLRDEGLIRAIGVCNFGPEHLTALHEETGEWPAINQVELHPYLQQSELRAFHDEHGIATEAWSPLGQGGELLHDPVVEEVAARHGVTPAQAVIRWHLQIGNVVIPKSVTPERIRSNRDVFGFALDEADLAAFAGLDVADHGGRIGPDPSDFHLGLE
ncbi:aldo/keto reductase [Janibacter sp. GXQ6167]|uniref:aldo/keto reductase n=1 Tax=Janibacter sp. GXQ6167 TaxID=3240791 RepID=UPI00352552C3